MSRTLVIGDIHGNYKGLLQCLERSNFDYENDILISLGDVVDGHSQSFEVVEELLKIKNLIAIKGNHDDWFNTYLTKRLHGSHWQQGALATNISYLEAIGKSSLGGIWHPDPVTGHLIPKLKVEDVPISHRNFFKNQLPYYIDNKNHLFIHGGFNRHLLLGQQSYSTYWWDRSLWEEALDFKFNGVYKFDMIENFSEVYIGHTSTQFSNSDEPMNVYNIWNIDTGGGWHGKVSILDVNTKEFWQSDKGNELYPDFKGR